MAKQTADTAIEKACRLAGGQTALAEKLDVSVQAVNKWVGAGKPPATRVLAIEEAIGGTVTRYELRPDVFGRPLRQSGAAKASCA